MLGTMYKGARNAGMSPRRAVTKIARELGIPADQVRRQLGIR